MTSFTWSEVSAGLPIIILTVLFFRWNRSTRANLTRSCLPNFVSQLIGGVIFGLFFSSGFILFLYLACIGFSTIPNIVWILRMPKSGPGS